MYKRYIPGKNFKFGVNISKIKSVFGYVSHSSKSKVEHKTLFDKNISLSNLKSDQRSLDMFVLRPGDEGYIDPRDKVVQDQPILINSGEEDRGVVDNPEDQQIDDPVVQQEDEQEFVNDPDVQHLNPVIEDDAEEGSSHTKNIKKDDKVPTKTRTRSLTPEKTKNHNNEIKVKQTKIQTRGHQGGTEPKQEQDMRIQIQVQDLVQELSQDLVKRTDLDLRETADRVRSQVRRNDIYEQQNSFFCMNPKNGKKMFLIENL